MGERGVGERVRGREGAEESESEWKRESVREYENERVSGRE